LLISLGAVFTIYYKQLFVKSPKTFMWITICTISLLSLMWIIDWIYQNYKKPKLLISFEFQEPWFKELPYFYDCNIKVEKPSRWIRVQIQNTSKSKIAHGCRVFISGVEYSPDGRKFQQVGFGQSQKLRWAEEEMNLYDPRDISHLERRLVDVFSVDPKYNKILIKWPEEWIANVDLFQRIGFYRLTIDTISEDAGSDTMKLKVRWTGQWDQINVQPVKGCGQIRRVSKYIIPK